MATTFARSISLSGVTLAALLLAWADPAHARIEFIGHINGERVYLIWGGECSALDPPNDNVALVELTYTGPPQPGVFTNVVLLPPFDNFSTDGETFLTVSASVPMPLPCPTCYEPFVQFGTTLPLEEPGAPSPIAYVEYNTVEGSCSGIAHRSAVAGIPAVQEWGLAAAFAALLSVGLLLAWQRRAVSAG